MSEQSLATIVNESIGDSLLAKQENPGFIRNSIVGIERAVRKAAYGAVISVAYIAGGAGLATILGCNNDLIMRAGGPDANVAKARIGSYPTATTFTNFLSLDELGEHGSVLERNGIVYADKGGHIDITHARKAIDLTMIYTVKMFDALNEGRTKVSFPTREGSNCFLEINYPSNWDSLSQDERKQIIHDLSIEAGKYLSFNVMTWHEIITWYGYKCTGVYSEFPSSFSWEETYSHALGINVADYALRKTGFPVDWNKFNNTVTSLLRQELVKLGIQSGETARYASKKMEGKWWSGGLVFFVDIKKRNLDIGLDGYVTPVLVPGISEGAEPEPLAVPTPDALSEYGFSVKFEIDPRIWEKDRIIATLNPSTTKIIDVRKHFPKIMDSIKKEAVNKYGYDTGVACYK